MAATAAQLFRWLAYLAGLQSQPLVSVCGLCAPPQPAQGRQQLPVLLCRLLSSCPGACCSVALQFASTSAALAYALLCALQRLKVSLNIASGPLHTSTFHASIHTIPIHLSQLPHCQFTGGTKIPETLHACSLLVLAYLSAYRTHPPVSSNPLPVHW